MPAADISEGDLLLVKPGEVVPVDGLVVSGIAALDESAVTGESRIVVREPSDRVASGVLNAGDPFDLRAIATADASTYAGIVRLVREAKASKAPFVRLADRYALLFLFASLGLAGLSWLLSGDPVRALAVLVVATPCPLLLAAPIAIVAGISRSARRGVIVKGGAALEALAAARTLLMDKTGTLTTGRPRVERVAVAAGGDADQVLTLAASLDQVVAACAGHGHRARGSRARVAADAAHAVSGSRPEPGCAGRSAGWPWRSAIATSWPPGGHFPSGPARSVSRS